MLEIGPHRLVHGDITSGAVARAMQGEMADVVYSDPPWGPGNQKFWHTMNRRGSSPRTSWSGFIASFASVVAIARASHAPVFVEMGLRWTDDLDDAMTNVGLPLRRRWRIFYGSKRRPLPNTVALFGPVDMDVAMPDPAHGEPVTRAVLRACVRPGAIVLDPCTGLGMTARLAHELGARFVGTELNAARLQRTATWLRARCS